MSYLSTLITARITKQVKSQLPQILPKEVSKFAPSVIKIIVTESLEHAVIAKESSQPKRQVYSVEEPEFEIADSDMPQYQEENLGDDDEEPKGKGISLWRIQRKDLLCMAHVMESTHDVYSTKHILALTQVEEGDFPRLCINDIEDMLILIIQNRLTNLSGDDVSNFAIALKQCSPKAWLFKSRIEDLQPGSQSKEVLKLKNIKKDGYTRFQHQEQYEHVGLEVTRSQEGKISQDDDKRLCLVDDLKEVQDSHTS
ncbi:hypothetical protein Tco_0876381 [Tanacetum coccineum]|uniref:Uncharacterized protein n=1 Tax=Tanacetum coccineum TaxID=301880 RepID=A0ABQ5BS75_9ASTR